MLQFTIVIYVYRVVQARVVLEQIRSITVANLTNNLCLQFTSLEP